MKIKNTTITIDLSKYEEFDDLVEEMFWKDLYLSFDDTTYIQNANQGLWYVPESKYHYADLEVLFKEGLTVTFYLLEDEGIIGNLEETFNPQ